MDDLIRKVSDLLNEQTAAYGRLENVTAQLSAALVRSEIPLIESLTKAAETELLRMRSRLLEITSALTKFAEGRAAEPDKTGLEAETRQKFDSAAKSLLEAARSFQKISHRTANLAMGGSSFASACIQMCGVPAMTYSAPVLKYAEAMR